MLHCVCLRLDYVNIMTHTWLNLSQHNKRNYSQTSIAQTSLGPWKFVLDIGSLSHRGLLMEPGLDAKGDY